jgi:dolichyl-phosphate-mannose-protein mannosyltransferase
MSAKGIKKYPDIWAALADPQVVFSILILYCLLHFLLRLLLSPNFTLDESEQMLWGQSLQLGYRFRHPPLITWLSWGTLTATGQSRAAFFLLKYLLMLGGLAVYFQAARLVIRDDKLAGLATFGLLTTIVMGYMPHIDLMHTVLLASLLAAYLWADAQMRLRGRWVDYILLGIVVGLGLLSKYVFAVLPIAMAVATLFVPRLRTRIRIVPLLVALLIALAIVAPYAWWARAHEYSLFALAQTITKSSGPALNVVNWLKGTGWLIVALAGFAIPVAAIFPFLYWNACKPLTAEQGDDADRDWLTLYGIAMLAGAIIMWGGVFFVGTEAFKARWMHQVLLPLPIWLFLRAKMAGPSERSNRIFLWLAVIFALAVVAARIGIYETGAKHCKACREYWPMKSYARSLQRTGFTGGTILAETYDLGGNLRGVFPEARVLTPGYPVESFGRPVPGQCVVIWEKARDMPKTLRDYLEGPLATKLGNSDVRGDISAQLIGTHRMETMSYVLLPKCGP